MMHRNKTARIAAEQRFLKHIGRMVVALERLRLAHEDHLDVDPELIEAAANFIRAPRAEA